MRMCVDPDDIVHGLIAQDETWCGWPRLWVGREWRKAQKKKEGLVVTCFECVAYATDPVRYGMR